jgi:hypothetical protein
VADLETVRLAIIAAILFKLEIVPADVSHAYIQAFTNGQVYTIAGLEFGELEGRILVIRKALYGLRTSGARWHEEIPDTLRAIGLNNPMQGKAFGCKKLTITTNMCACTWMM